MRYMQAMILMVAVGLVGCASGPAYPGYPPISGVVVNGVSGEPIVGAVVNVHMISPGGMDFPSKVPYSEEAVTDKEGRFSLRGFKYGALNVHMAIYKRGYACWSNDWIFNGTIHVEVRSDYATWQDGYTYQLQPWQEGWSYLNHTDFIRNSLGNIKPSKLFEDQYKWELKRAGQERREKGGY